MAVAFGCKRNDCCLPPETNSVVALKGNNEWRTTGYLFKQNTRKDTVIFSASKEQEHLVIHLKKSGSGYVMIDAGLYNLTGDIVNADYVLDASKSSSFNTLTSTDDLLEGEFTLYFKLNHGGTTYPSTVIFKNGIFRVRYDNIPPAPMHG